MPPEHVPNTLDPESEARIWEHRVAGRLLIKFFFRKLWNKYIDRRRQPYKLQPATHVDGLVIFDFADPTLFGGGTVQGPDFLRALIALRIGPVERLCDFCSGTGYIGYSLLARGVCQTLCCVDLHAPAIESVKVTAEFNHILDRVTAYVSDGLDRVPDHEKWGLVVANFPQLLPSGPSDTDTIFEFDPDWRLHRNFYANLKNHMVPGAMAIVMETTLGSTSSTFIPMIVAGGGTFVTELRARDFRGQEDDRYFVVSQW